MLQCDKPSIVVRNLSKSYRVKGTGASTVRGTLGKKNKRVQALQEVSLVAHPGDCIGLLGRNGSGKSTLLRLISGGDSPDSGDILVSSQPTLLGISAALQPRLTGRKNVRLGLLAQGLTPSCVEELEDAVADFAEIGDALDRPMETYSSGMSARLKFAIATAIKREILLVDEALSAGDAGFAARARERMQSFLTAAGTIFLVSHSAATIKESATRAIWLHDGVVIADGDPLEISDLYRQWAHRVSSQRSQAAEEVLQHARNSYVKPEIILESEQAPH